MLNALYLSGPMSGYLNLNYPEFNRVADILRKTTDFYIINPAAYTLPNTEWQDCLRFDLNLLFKLHTLKRIIFLPKWKKSKGARLESYVGELLGVEMYEYIQEPNNKYKLKKVSKAHIEPGDLETYVELMKVETAVIPVGITGKLHAGKDSLADFMIGFSDSTYHKYSFAEPMKRIAHEIFGFSNDQLYDPAKKEQIDNFWDITPRKFLQLLGTDMFRDIFRNDVWIKLAEKNMLDNPQKRLIVADVRFDNEAAFIKDQKGLLIEIKRKEDDAPAISRGHSSENGVNPDFVDIVVQNNGSFEDLEAAAVFIETMLFTGVIRTPLTLGV